MSARVGQDDPAARIARLAATRAFGVALDVLRDPTDARDAVQEAVAQALAGLASFRGDARLETWFYRILVNQCRRVRRRARVRAVLAPLLSVEPAGPPTPEHELARARLRTRLGAALERLSTQQRLVVVLRHVEQLDTAEVAAALGISEGSVKTHLFRALQRLREELRDER